jgi:8-oxo-dGTP pyrophosphatase MutT (NUDIX family)/phosphohistidine phosphatase SixA
MPNNKPGSRLIKAAGGVAWRPGPGGEPEILLVHRSKYDDWSLPKGKTEPDEPLPVTAAREVLEEGGARLALGRRLASVRYNVGGRPKRVHYWAARVLSVDARAVPNSEVDEVTWLTASQAVDKVSYTHDHGVLADFAARPAQTVPLILLRHAKALSKSGWKRADESRPLDDAGRSDAKALADLLACFAPRPRLISSTAARCTETLGPLSEVTGEQVRAEPSLYLHNASTLAGAADSAAGLTALVREVIAAGEPTVICAHRENLSLLQEAALAVLTGHSADASGAGAPGAGVPGDAVAQLPREWDDPLPTSGFWVLNVAPLPSVKAPAGPGEGPPSTAGPVAATPSASRPWWQRLLGGIVPARTRSAGTTPAGGQPGADDGDGGQAAAGGDAAGGGGEPAGPVGVLVSADRYDLSES